MDKILIVYNICGAKKDNTEGYIHFLNALSQQEFDGDKKIVVSACKPVERTIPFLKSVFPNFDYIRNDSSMPVNVTFNDAVLKSVKKYGDFDSYVYMACDAMFVHKKQLQILHDIGSGETSGLVSAQVDHDSCYAYGLKLGGGRHAIDDENARYEMFKDGKDYTVPPGRACAAHVNLYTHKMFSYYGRCTPDIFGGYCTESVFSFLVSALKLHWVISRNCLVKHYPSYDGPSSTMSQEEHKIKNPSNGSYDYPFMMDTLMPIFNNDYAKSIGLGYEECQNIVNHREDQFDGNYFCKNNLLKEYIKEKLFLDKGIFDYDKIPSFYV